MSSDYSIMVEKVSKKYQIYDKPVDRLKQFILGNKNTYYKEFIAVDKINMKIPKGSTVGIVGRNGSGKSTMLQMIAGTLTPTEGTIQVTGRIAALLELGAGFNPEFTGRENVYLNASILGIESAELDKRFEEILEFSEIGAFIDQPVKTYSSGMFVRLAFSVATLTDPEVVIIDEALSVGDEKFQRKCYNHLETLKQKGCTILFVSHSMKIVEQICDYAYLLEGGNLIGEGQPKQIIDQYHLMLYSHENEHIKNLNHTREKVSKVENESHDTDAVNEESDSNIHLKIIDVSMYNSNNAESYLYTSGSQSKIIVKLESLEHYEEVLIGIRIRTTQGVEVYGTSTSYHPINVAFAKKQTKQIVFTQDLTLISGIYHLSVAVAQKVGSNDMQYFDKKTDVLLFKIEEQSLTGTGIANLKSTIEVLEV